ncbi:MAG: SDR family NAD(P)-dependent oxidoreductase [Planctomycetia bacterium]|nr:SDR family NAD(P)-dependent oxidoreductase [Planctomycetia bacterium]
MNWKDKVVLVTGASSGLGRVIAEEFGKRSAKLALVGLESNDIQKVALELKSKEIDVLPIVADITQDSEVDRLVNDTVNHFGKLNVLVNSAGRTHRGKIQETSIDDFRAIFELNALGTIRCSQKAIPFLLKERGHIINIGSLASKSASRWVGAYPVSKFAVAAFSQQLRLELGKEGLHVLLVCPGPVKRENPRLYQLPNAEGIPESALLPGGGVKVHKIDPVWLAQKIIQYCEKRKPELIVPGKAKILFAISQLFPSLGDWIVLKKT